MYLFTFDRYVDVYGFMPNNVELVCELVIFTERITMHCQRVEELVFWALSVNKGEHFAPIKRNNLISVQLFFGNIQT